MLVLVSVNNNRGQGLPLASSSLRAQKYGTRVPSVEKLIKQVRGLPV